MDFAFIISSSYGYSENPNAFTLNKSDFSPKSSKNNNKSTMMNSEKQTLNLSKQECDIIELFDDYKDTSIYGVDSGLSKRFKWRIRYYEDDLSYIMLEKKEKIESRCHKKSCKITVDEYNKIVSGDLTDLIFETEKKLIKELAIDMLTHDYRPKVIIDYERIAYVEEITNVRITFDMKISASYEIENFLTQDYQSFYVLPSGMNVLEVKFDDILPSYMRKIVELYGFKQTSFSKYYYGRKIIDSYMR